MGWTIDTVEEGFIQDKGVCFKGSPILRIKLEIQRPDTMFRDNFDYFPWFSLPGKTGERST